MLSPTEKVLLVEYAWLDGAGSPKTSTSGKADERGESRWREGALLDGATPARKEWRLWRH